jgi:hypothetical protein
MKYQTLQFKDKELRTNLGEYVVIVESGDGGGFGGGSVPQLMKKTATIEMLQELYKEHDFSGVELITLKVKHAK